MRKLWAVALLLPGAGSAPVAGEGPKPREVPKEVRALEGSYTGSWTMYGVDEKGAVVKRMAWTDTLEVSGATVKGDRAYVTWKARQTFEGAKGPPLEVEGKEGHFLTREGALGDAFFELFGQVSRMVRLRENVWSYATPADAKELVGLGFPKGASGQHVVVKVVTREGGAQTHRVSRLTTVTWTDRDGKERVLQFVSLQGHHRRKR